jgi:Na+/proline symporter
MASTGSADVFIQRLERTISMRQKRVIVTWLVAVQLVGFSAAAHAYLDPGTGSILVQSLLAGIAGAVAIVSLYWQRLKAFFTNLRKPSHDTRTSASTSDNDPS